MKLSERIKEADPMIISPLLVVSDEIYSILELNHYDHAVMSCGCRTPDGTPQNLWIEIDTTIEDEISGDKAYYMHHIWCDTCGDKYLSGIMNA